MKEIYEIIGMVIFYGTICLCLVYVLLFIYFKYLDKFITSDLIKYLLGKSYETEFLRGVYYRYGKNKSMKRMVLKFRLRNIKRASK